MKKVCILSMQKVQNFGSLLQSYSLKKILEQLGMEVHFIDIERCEDDDKLVPKRAQFVKELEKNNGILSKIKKIDRYTLNRIRIKKISKQQDIYFENFRNNVLKICNTDNEMKYDLCVIGSDEVFNCMALTEWGFTSQLFGNVRQADNIITYAASCGATEYEQLNSQMISIIKKAFKNISSFSARDINTNTFIKHLTSNKVENNMDPVWIGNFDHEIDNSIITERLPTHYCIIYSYYNRIHEKNEIVDILKFCREKNLEPIAIGAPQMWVKNYVAVDPFEMLKIFQQADFIITDTFHGTIFSQKFNGKFAVLFRDSNKNKLSDLVKKIEAENHVINDFSELNRAYEAYENRKKINENISKCRHASLQYLKSNIK